jgi:penicillin-binding protein 1B
MKPLGPAPSGVEVLRIDRTTGLIADDSCPNNAFSAAFLIGAAPQGTCSHMGDDPQSLGSRIFGFFTGKSATPTSPPDDAQPADPTKHRNLLQKIFGTGKDKPKDQTPQ